MKENTDSQAQPSLGIWSFRWRFQAESAKKRIEAVLRKWNIQGKVQYYKIQEFSLQEKFHLTCEIKVGQIMEAELIQALIKAASSGHGLMLDERVREHLLKKKYADLKATNRELERLTAEHNKLIAEGEEQRQRDSMKIFGHPNASREEITAFFQTNLPILEQMRTSLEELQRTTEKMRNRFDE